jgi:hypothetical protein
MIQQGMMFNTLASIPLDSISFQTAPSCTTSDHLQRCMDSVQELARTITCAMDNWHGRGLLECSDIHGLYAKVSANLEQLPADVECMRCTRRTYKSSLHSSPSRVSLTSTCTCDANPEPAKRRRTLVAPHKLAAIDSAEPEFFTIRPSDIAIDAAVSSGRSSCDPRYVPQGDIRIQEDGLPPCSADLDLDHSPALADAQFPACPEPSALHDAHAALEQTGLKAEGEGLEPYSNQPTRRRFDHVEVQPPSRIHYGSSYNVETAEYYLATGNSPAIVADPVVVDEAPKPKPKPKKVSSSFIGRPQTQCALEAKESMPPPMLSRKPGGRPILTHTHTAPAESKRTQPRGPSRHSRHSEPPFLPSEYVDLDRRVGPGTEERQTPSSERNKSRSAQQYVVEDANGRKTIYDTREEAEAKARCLKRQQHHDEAEAYQANGQGNEQLTTTAAEYIKRASKTSQRDQRPAGYTFGSIKRSTVSPSSARTGAESNMYHDLVAARVPRSRDGDSPAVEVPYGSSSLGSRDRMPVDRMPIDSRMPVDRMPVDRIRVSRMPADRMTIDRKQDDRMQLNTPSGPPQGRRYPSDPRYGADARGYSNACLDPRDSRTSYSPQEQPLSVYGADADASQRRDARTPPGYVRQGNYYVPISSAEQSRTKYGSSHPYSQPAQPERMYTRMDTHEMRDSHYAPIPRNGKSTRKEENEQHYQPDRQKSSRNPRPSIDFPERMYIPPPPPPPPMSNPPLPSATYVPSGESYGPGIGIPPLPAPNDNSQQSIPGPQAQPMVANTVKRRPTGQYVDSMDRSSDCVKLLIEAGADVDVHSQQEQNQQQQQQRPKRPHLQAFPATNADSNMPSEGSAPYGRLRLGLFDNASSDVVTEDDIANDDDAGRDENVQDHGGAENHDDVTGNVPAVQALLNRWLNSSTSALLLKDDEIVT